VERLFALLNERLRRHRLERGWTLQDVADGLDALAPSELGKPHLGVTAAMVGDWERGRHRPRPPYPRLLCVLYDTSAEELGLYDQSSAELFDAEDVRAELPAGAQPWRLARALEAASIGSAGVTALEQAVGEFARSYPSTPPTVLAEPVLKHFRDVVRLLEGPLPVARRRRLAVVAGHLAGLAGNLSFDLREAPKALAYFEVAVQAADDADAPDVAAWALATRSIVPAYIGDPATALRLLQEAQERAAGHVSPSRRAWLAAMAARAHAGLGDARSSLAALGQAEAAIERAEPNGGPFGTDFFDLPRLAGFRGTCHLLLGQPQAAMAALAEVLALRSPTDIKGRSLARLDLAQAHAQASDLEAACAAVAEALTIGDEYRVDPIRRRAREVRAALNPWRDERPVKELDEQVRSLLSA
jgi:transcriptional regulator with XRE-family HTH domain